MGRNKKYSFEIGQKINNWTIISEPFVENKTKKIACRCICGKETIKICSEINKSQGCLQCSLEKTRKYKEGDKKHYLTFIKYLEEKKGKERLLEVKCVCGKIKKVTYGTWNRGSSCGCRHHLLGTESTAWKGGKYVPQWYFGVIKTRANQRGTKFDLTIEYIDLLFSQQDFKCKLSNLNIAFLAVHNHTASLDRIDSTKGYIEGNVQWVHKDINRIKSDLDLNYFLTLCKSVSETNYKD